MTTELNRTIIEEALREYVGDGEGEDVRVLRAFSALIWREGFDAGERDVLEHLGSSFDTPCIKNPYDDGEIPA